MSQVQRDKAGRGLSTEEVTPGRSRRLLQGLPRPRHRRPRGRPRTRQTAHRRVQGPQLHLTPATVLYVSRSKPRVTMPWSFQIVPPDWMPLKVSPGMEANRAVPGPALHNPCLGQFTRLLSWFWKGAHLGTVRNMVYTETQSSVSWVIMI